MKAEQIDYETQPGGSTAGAIQVPGDKSISHRAVILGSIADGTTRVSGLLEGSDVLATIRAFRQLGVNMSGPTKGVLDIRGVGLKGLSVPHGVLDMGNSGTAIRLLTGLLAGQTFATTLTGDESLSRRPMRRVTSPLSEMGARVVTSDGGTPPVEIKPQEGLHGIHYIMPVASAQVKSAILLAALYAQGETCVEEPASTRDHTERMLEGFGYPCHRSGKRICIRGGKLLIGTNIDVPADISSAAFFMVAATITGNSQLLLSHVGINPTRTGVIDILQRMGASIEIENERLVCGEPVADLTIRSAGLKGIDIPHELVPLAIDEFPILCIAAACASGVTRIRGASELRHKESDRIAVMVQGLDALGVSVEEFEDGLAIEGGQLTGGTVESGGDHRVAMAFCIAGARANGTIRVRDCGNIQTSFPGFAEIARETGLSVNVVG